MGKTYGSTIQNDDLMNIKRESILHYTPHISFCGYIQTMSRYIPITSLESGLSEKMRHP